MDARLTHLKSYIDAKESALIAVYVKNKRYAFWHNVGTTALGAFATALLGFSELNKQNAAYYRGATLVLTMSVTIFVSCDQFFRFRSRADAAQLAAGTLCDLREEINLKLAGSGVLNEAERSAFSQRCRAVVKNGDLIAEAGSIWTSDAESKSILAPKPLP